MSVMIPKPGLIIGILEHEEILYNPVYGSDCR